MAQASCNIMPGQAPATHDYICINSISHMSKNISHTVWASNSSSCDLCKQAWGLECLCNFYKFCAHMPVCTHSKHWPSHCVMCCDAASMADLHTDLQDPPRHANHSMHIQAFCDPSRLLPLTLVMHQSFPHSRHTNGP